MPRSKGAKTFVLIGSEDQPLSIMGMLSIAGFGGMGTLLGKNLLKRPKDYTPEEHDADVAVAFNAGAAKNANPTTGLDK